MALAPMAVTRARADTCTRTHACTRMHTHTPCTRVNTHIGTHTCTHTRTHAHLFQWLEGIGSGFGLPGSHYLSEFAWLKQLRSTFAEKGVCLSAFADKGVCFSKIEDEEEAETNSEKQCFALAFCSSPLISACALFSEPLGLWSRPSVQLPGA